MCALKVAMEYKKNRLVVKFIHVDICLNQYRYHRISCNKMHSDNIAKLQDFTRLNSGLQKCLSQVSLEKERVILHISGFQTDMN